MADLSDVSAALQALAVQALYPSGTAQPSVAGVPIKVYPGWPIPLQLDPDLAAGTCHVSIFPRPEEHNTTRFSRDPQAQVVNVATLTATILGQTVTIAGTIPAANNPTNVSVEVQGLAFVYAVQPTDTLTGIATALSALIAASIAGTSNAGPVITIGGTRAPTAARVGITATSVREIRRQRRVFMLTVWADSPQHRDAIAQPLDIALAELSFITMPDTFAARLIYRGSMVSDAQEKAGQYRRDLLYSVEYATTDTLVSTQVTQEVVTVTPALNTTPAITLNL